MATEFLYATSHLAGDFPSAANAVGNTPTTWAGTINANTNYTSRWAIGDPVDPLTAGVFHTVRVFARKGGNSGTPTIQVNLYENGVLVQSIIPTTNITARSDLSQVQTLSGQFLTSAISDQTLVEIEVVQISAGGSPSVRNSAQISHIEWEATTTAASTDRVARVSWAELEVPTAPRHARLSWAELEVATAPRVARLSWAEMEIPTAPRVARISWAEMELPLAPRLARVSWAELETPDASRAGVVTWVELEVPTAPRAGVVTWVEMELPLAPRQAVVTWTELEVPSVGQVDSYAQLSWAELEVPTAPREALLSWAELEVATAPRRALVSWVELEAPTAPRRVLVSWAEAEVPTAPRVSVLTWSELEAPDAVLADSRAVITWAVLEVPLVGGDGDVRIVQVGMTNIW